MDFTRKGFTHRILSRYLITARTISILVQLEPYTLQQRLLLHMVKPFGVPPDVTGRVYLLDYYRSFWILSHIELQ